MISIYEHTMKIVKYHEKIKHQSKISPEVNFKKINGMEGIKIRHQHGVRHKISSYRAVFTFLNSKVIFVCF
jgi:hypothetical protein